MEPDVTALVLFLVSYAGVAVGAVPHLAIDRTGIALLGAIAMVGARVIDIDEAVGAIDVPTILLLYALMVVSGQFRVSGLYARVARRIVANLSEPRRFLALLMVASAVLSALLVNDIVCLAFAPVVCVALLRASLDPVPFLLGMTAASNIGSAATLIGNPQNMLIGQVGRLDFGAFLLWSTPPVIVALVATWVLVVWMYRGRWARPGARSEDLRMASVEYDAHQSHKGLLWALVLLVLFFLPIPRELSALCVAGALLCSRHVKTRTLLGLVDWHLITLFAALFAIVAGISKYGWPQAAVAALADHGVSLRDPWMLSGVTLVLSNVVSNVPAVMLLLQNVDPTSTTSLYLVALVSTFAGNLLTIGSIANLITIEQASQCGVRIGFREHARLGVPVTVISVLVAVGWFALAG